MTEKILCESLRRAVSELLLYCAADAECLQRAVEGRAASDEEEEDRRPREEGQCCLLEVKKHISRLHSCGKGLADVYIFKPELIGCLL